MYRLYRTIFSVLLASAFIATAVHAQCRNLLAADGLRIVHPANSAQLRELLPSGKIVGMSSTADHMYVALQSATSWSTSIYRFNYAEKRFVEIGEIDEWGYNRRIEFHPSGKFVFNLGYNSINIVPLDTLQIQPLLTIPNHWIHDVQYDEASNSLAYVYSHHEDTFAIEVLNLDTMSRRTIAAGPSPFNENISHFSPVRLAIDSDNDSLFFVYHAVSSEKVTVKKYSLSDSREQTIAEFSQVPWVGAVDIDPVLNKVYVGIHRSRYGDSFVFSANYDGSDIQQIASDARGEMQSLVAIHGIEGAVVVGYYDAFTYSLDGENFQSVAKFNSPDSVIVDQSQTPAVVYYTVSETNQAFQTDLLGSFSQLLPQAANELFPNPSPAASLQKSEEICGRAKSFGTPHKREFGTWAPEVTTQGGNPIYGIWASNSTYREARDIAYGVSTRWGLPGDTPIFADLLGDGIMHPSV